MERKDDSPAPDLRSVIDSISLYYRLRQRGRHLIGAAIIDNGKVYRCSDEWDPWGSKQRISWAEFQQWVDEAHLRAVERKPVSAAEGVPLGKEVKAG